MSAGSLRLRLLFAGAVSVFAALALSAAGLTILFERHVERRVEAELRTHLDQIIASIDRDDAGAYVMTRPIADPRFAEPLSGLYWQVSVGSVQLRSRSLWDAELDLPTDELPDGSVHRHRVPGPSDAELIVVERGVVLPERLGGVAARAAVALDASEVRTAARVFAAELTPYLALLALFLIGASYAQVTIGLRPLAAIRRRLAAIVAGRERRLGSDFPDEIHPLAAEVDSLLEARELQIERARARAADLAHGLKTPLQVLSGDVDRLKAKGETEIADGIRQTVASMRRHVDRELARARSAAGRPDARADVAEVVRRVVAVLSRTPEGARLVWQVGIPAGTSAKIDADDLAEAIGNLAENAARHARTSVSVEARAARGTVSISVKDDGPGIAGGDIETAMVRGGRLDLRGQGAGLGLAIVADMAQAWGGRFDIRSGDSGVEAVFGIAEA